VKAFCAMTGEDVGSFAGYLRAHEKRRADFRAAGATSTDHGHPTAFTAHLSRPEIEALYAKVMAGPSARRRRSCSAAICWWKWRACRSRTAW
jgi:glucuronate isomerase